jgi:hypothetical protein
MKKQEIAKAVAISRAKDFTGAASPSPLRGGSDGVAGRGGDGDLSQPGKTSPPTPIFASSDRPSPQGGG